MHRLGACKASPLKHRHAQHRPNLSLVRSAPFGFANCPGRHAKGGRPATRRRIGGYASSAVSVAVTAGISIAAWRRPQRRAKPVLKSSQQAMVHVVAELTIKVEVTCVREETLSLATFAFFEAGA